MVAVDHADGDLCFTDDAIEPSPMHDTASPESYPCCTLCVSRATPDWTRLAASVSMEYRLLLAASRLVRSCVREVISVDVEQAACG